MKTITFILPVMVCMMFLASGLFAQKTDKSKEMEKAAHNAFKEILKEVDKNKDGKLSKTEFNGIWKDPKVANENWNFWNTNKDGFITEDEYVKAATDIGKKK